MVWLVRTRKQWIEGAPYRAIQTEVGLVQLSEGEVIERNAEWLLERLYRPSSEFGNGVDVNIVARFGMDGEVINWGDLGASVEQVDGQWVITLEEARADSVNLCQYVEGWLRKWGWEVHVEATW